MRLDTSAPGRGAGQDRVLGGRVALVGLVAAVLALYVVHGSLPTNPLSLPLERSSTLRAFVPEGWGFFTASPRDTTPLPLRRGPSGVWTSVAAGALAVPADAFGADRVRRAQGTEIALVLHDVPKGSWSTCREAPAACLERLPVFGTRSDVSPGKTICGDIGFVRQEVLPWAWRSAAGQTVMPSQVLRLRVAC
jgi:antimicrobial peptide system SdpA family protein